jgi:hypothetical protein
MIKNQIDDYASNCDFDPKTYIKQLLRPIYAWNTKQLVYSRRKNNDQQASNNCIKRTSSCI